MNFGLCLEMVYTNLDFEVRIQKVAQLGFKNVEMWFTDASFKGSPEQLAKILSDNKVKMTNTVIGSPDGVIGGGLTNPANREQWLDRARKTIAFNKIAGIPATIVCTGNIVPGMSTEQMAASVMEGLKLTVDLAEKNDITLLIEPLNLPYDHEGYFLSSSDAAAEICREIKSPHLKLLFDCYHMQIMDGDLINHIKRHIDVIGHFHSAGVPGRHELFNSEIHYLYVIEQISQMDYKGIFSLEYAPSMDDTKSLKKTLGYLAPVAS